MVSEVQGGFYEVGSSVSVDATLRVGPREEIEICFAGKRLAFAKGEYVVEPPLGSLPRVVHFSQLAGDCRFESKDLLGFRQLEASLTGGEAWAAIAWLEGHWKGAIGSLVLLAFICFGFLQWGLPGLAWKVAQDMPQSWRQEMTEQSVSSLERFGLVGESRLEPEERERAQGIFSDALALAAADESRFDYELRLYSGEKMGANAFAFPSGLVVATDEFVALCETDDQILSVFLHEIAHVEQQHGIRSLVQRGGVFVVFSIIVGDVSAAISLAEGIPALVMNSRYSQRFELESDTFAARILEASGSGAESMKEILILLHKDVPEVPVAAFLSSHPSLQERVENLDEIALGEE